jgi:hypothetical protein
LSLLEQPNLDQQVHGLGGRVLELPVTILECGVFPQIGAAAVEEVALAQNTIDEPAFFQLKNLFGERPSFVPGNCHAMTPENLIASGLYARPSGPPAAPKIV